MPILDHIKEDQRANFGSTRMILSVSSKIIFCGPYGMLWMAEIGT